MDRTDERSLKKRSENGRMAASGIGRLKSVEGVSSTSTAVVLPTLKEKGGRY